MKTQRYLLITLLVLLLIGGVISSGISGITWSSINQFVTHFQSGLPKTVLNKPPVVNGTVRITNEESVVIDAVDKASPSVVTIIVNNPPSMRQNSQFSPQPAAQDIGTGFIINTDGYIVTSKHVVSDTEATYKIITKDDKSYDVKKIYRDPTNDLAIVKIDSSGLTPIEMGDSSKIKVGQLAIAIGTALGEFRNTVTTGVVSGVGRGIDAGSQFEGSVERLDNVIQTDAAINPGNSGGPLLNSAGQVIGVNTAVSAEGQNIGFAIPINVVKDALTNFNSTGQFNRPFLGIRYRTVSKDIAIMNDIPEGAYVLEVVAGSPAEKAGIQTGDIITSVGNTRLTGNNAELATAISSMKVGESVAVTIWRDGKTVNETATLTTQ